MKLNRDNYESWALDYVEGTLGAEDRTAFEAFLAGHSDIAREVRSLQTGMPVLPVEHCTYPDKQSLLRGGRAVTLTRIGSFLGGMAAASLLIGLFLLVDRHSSSDEAVLLGQQLSAQQEGEVAEETAESRQEPVAETESVPAADKISVPAAQRLASVQPVRVSVPARSARPVRNSFEPAAPVLAGNAVRAELRGAGPSQLECDPAATPIAISTPRKDGLVSAPVSFRESSRGDLASETAAESENSPEITSGRRALASILAPLDYIIPIKTYRTEDESGVEIISLIRIGNKNTKNNH